MSQRKELINYIFMSPEDDAGSDQMDFNTPRGGTDRSHLQDGRNGHQQYDPEMGGENERNGEASQIRNHILYLLAEIDHEKNDEFMNIQHQQRKKPGYSVFNTEMDYDNEQSIQPLYTDQQMLER